MFVSALLSKANISNMIKNITDSNPSKRYCIVYKYDAKHSPLISLSSNLILD